MADLTAILSILRNNDVRRYVADATKGDFSKKNIIHNLAEEFGENVSQEIYGPAARPYLRTAHNQKKMKSEENWDPYDMSLIMTGGMFEILTKMIFKQYPNEATKKKGKTWWRTPVWKATSHFTRLALRALDFCPPADIQFIDYIRAMLHADEQTYPGDKYNYRGIIREVFHKRGFCSKSKKDHDGLCDLNPQKPLYNVELQRYDIGRISGSRTAAYHFLNLNRAKLHIPIDQDITVVDLYATHKEAEAGRKLPREIILEYLWCEDVPLYDPKFGRLQGEILQLLCGGTLVFDGRGNILYFVHKPGTESPKHRKEGEIRKNQLKNYVANLIRKRQIGLVDEDESPEMWTPAVIGQRVNGRIQLEVTPHLRHHGGE